MSLFQKPSELAIRPTFKALIYGEPGIGKSTLALSAPNPVVFDFDGGITRVNAAFQCPALQIGNRTDANGNVVLAWEVVRQALDELKAGGTGFKTIVIDTAGKMLDYMSDYIIRTDRSPKHLMSTASGELSMQGYGVRKRMFVNFLFECATLNMNVVFVAHAKEEKKKKGNEEFVYIRPDIGGSSSGDLIKELDLVGYARANGYQRVITWNPCDEFYAKNACNLQPDMSINTIIDKNGNITGNNNFMTTIFDIYAKYLEKQREIRAKYDALMANVNAEIAAINTIEEANKFKDKLLASEKSAIWDSVVRSKTALHERCTALGFKFNKTTGNYEAA